MNIAGFLAVGNEEKCPYCDLIITEEIDSLGHMINKHPKELKKMLYPKIERPFWYVYN